MIAVTERSFIPFKAAETLRGLSDVHYKNNNQVAAQS